MFLKRLDLVGFKSFAPRTTTELQPGIVVVVGPNGSGKSNIADAVRWVLGEQSSRAVRARKAEEVIFAGSGSRQPLGMAEVSLVLDNTDSSLPIEYSEVRVTRRLYRSGESEYLLNGAKVRLRDITQLLLHAGLSPDSYTVIGQGSIDELILQRPEERRIAFESAADIRRHQLRLNDTRAKLTATDANLVRVQDVIAELAPHVRRLKSQAERAAREDHLRTELHDLLLRSYRVRLFRARAGLRDAEGALHAAARATDAAEANTAATEHAFAELERALGALDEQLAVLRPRVESFREQARATERGLAVARERAAGLSEQTLATEQEVERLAAQVTRLEGDVDSVEHDAVDGAEEAGPLESGREQLAQLRNALQVGQAERRRVHDEQRAQERSIGEAESRLARAERELSALESALAVDEARQTDRDARLQALEQQLEALQRDLASAQMDHETTRAAVAAAEEARVRAQADLETASQPMQASRAHADRLHGALAALGASTNASTTPAEFDGLALLTDLPVLGLAGELASRVRPIDGLLRSYLLRTVVLGDDASAREAHRRLIAGLPEQTPAWSVLSLEGLLLTPGGARPLAASSDDGASALADWRAQVQQLERDLAAAEASRAAAERAHSHARQQLTEAEHTAAEARAAATAASAHLEQLRRAERDAAAERHRLRIERDQLGRELALRPTERLRAVAAVDAQRTALEAAREERQASTDNVRAIDSRLSTLSDQVQHAQAELASQETAQAQRQAERAARATVRQRIVTELANARQALGAATQRREHLAGQANELAQREGHLTDELQQILRQLAPMEEQLSAAELERAELGARRRGVELRLADLRTAERIAREAREEQHVLAQRAADDLARLEAEIAETAELEADVAGGAAWAEQLALDLETDESPAEGPGVDLDAMRRRIAVLQRELRSVGGVAESVVAEYRELSDRHDFLVHQSEDLRAAMVELREAEAELEGHMRERFAAVFEATQAAFQSCFVTLFGGGEARLVLTLPDDLLRTGVDIVARPPGKKLQGLLSLSGGERALTMVALLFGLLRVNPTPFCVLDEVDAALDEANVQRFANLLSDFAHGIQFVVVTHNRATMDRADALYGVSMDGQGISHIFSIRPQVVASAVASA